MANYFPQQQGREQPESFKKRPYRTYIWPETQLWNRWILLHWCWITQNMQLYAVKSAVYILFKMQIIQGLHNLLFDRFRWLSAWTEKYAANYLLAFCYLATSCYQLLHTRPLTSSFPQVPPPQRHESPIHNEALAPRDWTRRPHLHGRKNNEVTAGDRFVTLICFLIYSPPALGQQWLN